MGDSSLSSSSPWSEDNLCVCVANNLHWLNMSEFHSVIILLVVIFGAPALAQGCSPGWFGKGCMFKCNCANLSMCGTDGTCGKNTSCMWGYFGPYCQYSDLVARYSTNSTEPYLQDGDDATCNPDERSTEVYVTLTENFTFTWLRIRVNGNINMHKFTVEFNEPTVPGTQERKFKVSEMEVDITYDVGVRMDTVTVVGSIAPFICSIYISGGRNVALKQETWMSRVYSADSNGSASSNAVDGNSSTDDASKSCAKTEDAVLPEWRLTYDKLYTIYYIVIYTTDAMTGRLEEFSLELLDSFNQRVVNFQFSGSTSEPVYLVSLDNGTALKGLKVVPTGTANATDRIVTICEVETYGDVICESNKFGLLCQNVCACSSVEVCNQHTGRCSTGCPVGSYGRDCTLHCSRLCLDNMCSVDTGLCISCVPGYTGQTCTTACPVGTYGPNCKFNCSELCSHSCNHTNGNCHCSYNFDGPICADCAQGFFGKNCTKTCPKHCEICHRDTGQCVKCRGTRLLPKCAGCPATFYGVSCQLRCSTKCMNRVCDNERGLCFKCRQRWYGSRCRLKCSGTCMNRTCDFVSGHCHVCQEGFHGVRCQTAETESNDDWFALTLMASSLVVCALFICCLLTQLTVPDTLPEQAPCDIVL